jgi:hypothetical protein
MSNDHFELPPILSYRSILNKYCEYDFIYHQEKEECERRKVRGAATLEDMRKRARRQKGKPGRLPYSKVPACTKEYMYGTFESAAGQAKGRGGSHEMGAGIMTAPAEIA